MLRKIIPTTLLFLLLSACSSQHQYERINYFEGALSNVFYGHQGNIVCVYTPDPKIPKLPTVAGFSAVLPKTAYQCPNRALFNTKTHKVSWLD